MREREEHKSGNLEGLKWFCGGILGIKSLKCGPAHTLTDNPPKISNYEMIKIIQGEI